MNIDKLHNLCKISTRKAFEEYKRQIEVRLFPLSDSLHENFKAQMKQDIFMPVMKIFVNSENLSGTQIKILQEITKEYVDIANKASDNYFKKLSCHLF